MPSVKKVQCPECAAETAIPRRSRAAGIYEQYVKEMHDHPDIKALPNKARFAAIGEMWKKDKKDYTAKNKNPEEKKEKAPRAPRINKVQCKNCGFMVKIPRKKRNAGEYALFVKQQHQTEAIKKLHSNQRFKAIGELWKLEKKKRAAAKKA